MNAAARDEPFVFVGTSDLAGLVRGKAFPEADLAERAASGIGLTASNIMLSAFGPIYATPFGTLGDLALVPDLTTRAAIPAGEGTSLDLVLGDIRNLDGTPWPCCPRAFLARALDALDDEFGLTLVAAFEQEFVYTGVAERPGSSYGFDRYRRAGTLGARIGGALRSAGIVPDSFLPEYGERQFEVTVKPRAGLRAADDAVLSREIIRGCAAEAGGRAILTPALEPDGIGNGTHVHFSFRDRAGRPVTYDPSATFGINPLVAPFVAGIVEHMPALSALTAPSAASYYRLRPNKWAPTRADLAERDRGAALRVCPIFTSDPATAAAQFNLEYRIADATASPYLALGAIAHAGLTGLRRNAVLPFGAARSVATALPSTLAAALEHLAGDTAARAWLGELLDVYLLFKRSELEALSGLNDEQICARYREVY